MIPTMRSKKGQFMKGNIPWNKGKGVYKRCLNCDKKIYVIQSDIKKSIGHFCSKKCWRNFPIKESQNFKLNEDLAEFIGVIIGDGCINRNGRYGYRIFISGNPIEDKHYMENYLPKLIKRCVNKDLKPFVASNGAYLLQFTKKSFKIFLENLGIKENKTRTVRIPHKIRENNKLLRACIRGVADTDFTLIFTKRKRKVGYYPRICAQFASKNLVKDLEKSLRDFGFTLNVSYDNKRKDKRGHSWGTNMINIDGPHNLNRWLNLIGFGNMRIISRYKVWEKLGYLPRNSTLPERMKILNEGQQGGELK